MSREHRISFSVTAREKAEIDAYCRHKRRWKKISDLARDAVWQLVSRNPVSPQKKLRPADKEPSSIERLKSLKGYVYLIRSGDYYKIGVTRVHPHARAKQLQTPLGAQVVNFLYVDYPHAVERELHEKYAQYRKNGEWFSFDELPEEFAK